MEKETTVSGYHCERCGLLVIPIKADSDIAACPQCGREFAARDVVGGEEVYTRRERPEPKPEDGHALGVARVPRGFPTMALVAAMNLYEEMSHGKHARETWRERESTEHWDHFAAHMESFSFGESYDPDSGYNPIVHAIVRLLMFAEVAARDAAMASREEGAE